MLLLTSPLLWAQPNTEVYLFDLYEKEGGIALSNMRNISSNEGYDNQPSFYDENTILFSSTRSGQTDIARYDIKTGEVSWITDTLGGSEYSPLRIPNSEDISAIRLDTTGLQRLYRYNPVTGKSNELLKGLKVGYHVWYDENLLVSSVLVEDRMDLVVSNLTDGSNTTVQKNVGRSLHKIPNTDLISYMSNENSGWVIKSMNPITGATNDIFKAVRGSQDMCLSSDGGILMSLGKSLVKYNPVKDQNWSSIWHFGQSGIHHVTRMAISPNGKQIAIVAEGSPEAIVQEQVESYNAGNLDAFVNCYSEDVVVRKFPADTLYVGHEKMRRNYNGLSPDKKVYDVEVTKRIVIGNKVIDEEKVTGNGRIQMQVALYEVNDGAISSMTFIFDDDKAPDPETIVQKQLDAYNARDIDRFLNTYTQDVGLFNFPAEKRTKGQNEMRGNYAKFFESTPDLHCEIKNRMVIGNKVIDEEYITANGNNFSAVAIYEVENGKISKVTFLR